MSDVDIATEAKRLLDAGQIGPAVELFGSLTRNEDSARLAAVRDRAYRAAVPFWHFAMMNDQPRNETFRAAFRSVGVAGKDVLEIGTGAGLLAMMLAKENPRSLTSCEAVDIMYDMARQVVADNHLSDRVKLLNKLSTSLEVGVDIADKVDVIVAEIVDGVLIGEGILPSLRDARERLLKVGGRIIPSAMRLYATPFSSELLHRRNFIEPVTEFDLSRFNAYATLIHRPVVFGIHPHALLGPAVQLFDIDLMLHDLKPFRGEAEVPIAADGALHGYALWFELELAPGVVVANPPHDIHSHWGQSIVIVPERAVRVGDSLKVSFEADDFHFLLKA